MSLLSERDERIRQLECELVLANEAAEFHRNNALNKMGLLQERDKRIQELQQDSSGKSSLTELENRVKECDAQIAGLRAESEHYISQIRQLEVAVKRLEGEQIECDSALARARADLQTKDREVSALKKECEKYRDMAGEWRSKFLDTCAATR